MLNYTLILSNCAFYLGQRPRYKAGQKASLEKQVLLFLLLCAIPAQLPAQTQGELNQIKSTLKLSEKNLGHNKTQKTLTLARIEALEMQLVERSSRHTETVEKTSLLTIKADSMEAELNALEQRLGREKNQLSRLVESAYLMGRQSGLKIALSQTGVQKTARLNNYAHFIAQARKTQLSSLSALKSEQTAKTKTLNDQKTQLDKLRLALEEDQRYLGQLMKNRLAMVKKLELSIDHGTQTVDDLRARKIRLESVLTKIAKRKKARAALEKARQKQAKAAELKRRNAAQTARAVSKPTPKKAEKPLVSTGSLPMPAQAKIVARFGQKRAESGLPWSGILMEGLDGSDIRSINAGEVVFADWLQGYGQMIIIDHGNSVMSLYGHNKKILKAVGDRVRQSDIIASMGDTAGLKKAALYFEIRKNGVAQDPLKWCRL